MGHVRQRLAIVGIALTTILLGGTMGFVLIEGYTIFEAFYMTLITVTTVGYGEVRELTEAGRLFNIFLILFGVVVMFLAVGAMTQTLIELELNQYFGKRRVNHMIDQLRNHIIICGFGRVGRGAAAELTQTGTPFVVVDRDADRVERAMKLGMLAVQADASQDDTLRQVGIARATGLIASLASDADNLFVILTARTLNPSIQLSARIAEDTSEQKMRRAGATHVFAPYISTGHRMAQAILKPHVLQFLDYTTQKSMGLDVGLEQVRVEDRCKYIDHTLEELRVRRDLGVIVLAIRRSNGSMLFNPPADAKLAGGDYLIVMGPPEGLQKLERLMYGHE